MGRSLTDTDRAAIKAILTGGQGIRRKKSTSLRVAQWPFKSDALGVSPDQVPIARENARKHGIPLEFTTDGQAVITGPKQYSKVAKAMGLYSGRDGYEEAGPTGRASAEGRRRLREQVNALCEW